MVFPVYHKGHAFFTKKSHNVFIKAGLRQSKCEPCLYFDSDNSIYLVVWVDDIFLFYPKYSAKAAERLWKLLQAELDLDDFEDIEDCLACNIIRDVDNKKIMLTQEKSIRKLIAKVGLSDSSDAETPMAANTKLSKSDCPDSITAATMLEEQKWYRSTVASLIYFSNWTRPDLTYAVGKLCKYMHNPGKAHVIALKRTLRYLKATADYGLVYDFGFNNNRSVKSGVYGYYDASHADDTDSRKSTMGFIFYLEGCPITWKSKLHSFITTSTNHSEYCSAAKASREAKYLDLLFCEMGFGNLVKPIDLFSDSKGAIAMTYNPVHRSASKHVDLADHYTRELQKLGIITVSYVSTRDMIADILTKPLGKILFARLVSYLVGRVSVAAGFTRGEVTETKD